jgi:predicted enzyme involved in methoxymalonyl-ACP biosynthesis
MLHSEFRRREVERAFSGGPEEFLASLGMRLALRPAAGDDLRRAEELTVRSHRFNTTGRTYFFE